MSTKYPESEKAGFHGSHSHVAPPPLPPEESKAPPAPPELAADSFRGIDRQHKALALTADTLTAVRKLCAVASEYHPSAGDSIGDQARALLERLG
jgi:hypothetical protein